MSRRWKILIGVLLTLLVVLILNAIAIDRQTKDARKTVESGRLIDTIGGQVQVTDSGAREKSPIVLISCYTCSLHWWDQMVPLLEDNHRVIRVEPLGHGGSEKPSSGYSIPDQAAAVATALGELGVANATVVGHSLGFTIATSLVEQSPGLVSRLVDIDQAPDNGYGDLPLTQKLISWPLIGQAAYRVAPDWEIRDGVKIAFAPGFNLANGFEDPDQPVEDVRAMTYDSFTETAEEEDSYMDEEPLDERLEALETPVPVLVIFGAEDQAYDAERSTEAFADVPGAEIVLLEGAGHSPNMELPEETAERILAFAQTPGDEPLPSTAEFPPPNKQTAKPKRKKSRDRKGS